MRVVARRREGYVHDVEIDDAHTIRVDEPVAAGGTDAGPGPTRLVAAGLASCIAITMEMYARRKGWELGAVEVAVEAEYEGYVPTSFAVTVGLSAEVEPERRERLLTVARKCPVHKVLAHETQVTVSEDVETL